MKIHPALVGAAAWLVSTIALGLGVIESLFLWAPLVVVPLGLERVTSLNRAARAGLLGAALLAAASFGRPAGAAAAALAAPWALACGAMALFGAWRFFRRGRWDPVETCVDAALGLIAVGGFGLAMSRAGLKPGGFEEPIVLLTAVHFHYTGFAAPLLIGLAGRHAGPRLPILLAGAAVVIATPLLAVGFTLRLPLAKVIAAGTIAAGLALFAGELVRLAVDERRPGPRLLLGLAAFSIFWGMVMVGFYAMGEYLGRDLVAIPAMAWSHGILNAFGFATGGLLAARTWRT